MEQEKLSPEEKEKQEKLARKKLEKEARENRKKEWSEIVIAALVGLYHLTLTVVTTLWIFTNNFRCVKSKLGALTMFDVNEHVTYGLFCAGVLGGSFYCLRALYQKIADAYAPSNPKQALKPLRMRAWAFWYVYRPLQGGVLALILLVLTKSSLMQIQNPSGVDSSSYYTLVGVGFLAGFGAHEVIEKIRQIIKVIFASPQDSGDAGGGSASSAGNGNAGNGGAGNGGSNSSNGDANQSGGNGNANANTGGNDSQNTKSETPTNEESGASSTEEPSPEENPVNGEGSDLPKQGPINN